MIGLVIFIDSRPVYLWLMLVKLSRILYWRSGQVVYVGIRRSSVSPRPRCDGSLRPPSGPRQGRRHARYARISQTVLHMTQTRSQWTPSQHGPTTRISTGKNHMGGILHSESHHMPIEAKYIKDLLEIYFRTTHTIFTLNGHRKPELSP